MISTKKIVFSLVLTVVSLSCLAQSGTVTASSSNNWNNVATWTQNITRSGTVTASTNSATVTGVNTNFLTELTVGSVIERTSGGTDIGTVASIQSNTSLTLTTNAGIAVNNLAYRTIDGPPSSVDALVINNGVTLTMNVSGSYTVASVTLNLGNNTSVITINAGVTLDVTGNITYNSGTGANDHKTINVSGTLNAANINMVNTSGDTWDNILSISTTGTVNLDGNLTMPGSFLRNHVDLTGNAVINIGGNVNNGAGAVGGGFTTPPSTSTINLNGTSAQTVFLYGGASALGIVKINNAAGVTSGSTMTVTTLTIGDVTTNSIFSDGGNQVTSTGTLNLTTGTLKLGATAATTFPAFATRNISSGTFVEYAANAAQTVSTAPSYQHLTFSGSGTKTVASGTLSVAGNWAVGSTTALNTNNPTVTVTGNITGSGNITSTSGTLSIGGNWTNNGSFTHNSGTISFNGSSAQSFTPAASSSFSTVKINNASGINLGAAITVATLTIGDVTANSIFSDGGNQVTSTGTLNLTSGTFKLGATAATTFPAFATRNISSGTIIEYAANASQTVSITPSYQNLTFSGSGVKTFSSGTLNVAVNWAVGSGATLVNAQTYNITGNISGTGIITSGTTSTINIGGNWTNTGNFVPSTGTVNFNGSSAQSFAPIAAETFNIVKINNAAGVNLGVAITVATLTIGDVTGSSIFSDEGNQVTSTGTLNLTSGVFKLGATAATTFPAFATRNISAGTTVEYAANAAQTVATIPAYHHLTFSGSGTKTVSSGTLSVAGNWAVGSAAALNTNNPTVNITGNITGSGNITSTSGTLSIAGAWTNSGTFTHNSGTVAYTSTTGGQTIAGVSYSSLTLSNTSGTNTAGTSISVGSTFAMTNANAVLDMVGFDLTINGGLSMAGTVKTQSTSSQPISAGFSWGGTVEYNNLAGGQNIAGGSYTNLKSSNTSNTNLALDSLTVGGLLTIADGGTLDMGVYSLKGGMTVSGTGTIKTQSASSTSLPAGVTWSTPIEFNRSGTQTVVSGTYGTLNIAGSGTKTMNGNVTISGALNLNSGTLAVSSRTLTLQTNSLSRTSGFLNTSAGTLVFDYNGSVTIPSSFFNAVNNMTLSSGAIVNLPSTAVTIAGTVNLSSGKLVMGSGTTLAMGGTVNMTASNCLVGNTTTNTVLQVSAGSGKSNMGFIYMDQTTPGTTNTVPTLTFTRTSITDTVGFGNEIRVKTVLTPTAGTVVSNGNVTIGSDANGTGKIYPEINAANFRFSGNVKVERYAKSKVARRFIMISSPVDQITVRDAWQDDIFITGPGTGGMPCGPKTINGIDSSKYNSKGFDATIGNVVSLFRYDQNVAAGWVAIDTTGYKLEKGKGYRILYRGERGINDANCSTYLQTQIPPAPSEATMNVSGTLVTGDFTVTVDGPTNGGTYGYTLLGNPWACELDFTKFAATNTNSVAPTYWIYDPNGAGTTTSNTTYLSYTATGGGEVAGFYHSDPNGDPLNYPNPAFLASGQAFFVQASTTGLATFKETDKGAQSQAGLFKTESIDSKIRINFKRADNTPIDNIVVRFSDDPSVTLAESKYWDVVSFNSGMYLATMKSTKSFAIQTRPLNFLNDTVQLRVVSNATGNFKLVFSNYASFTQAAQIILIDQFSGTQTDVKANPEYAFTITGSSASQGTRFRLVFRSVTSVMPLSYLNISAKQKTQGVEVTWKVAFEQGVAKYQVERSEDGSNFTAIGLVESKGNSNVPVEYLYTDTKPLAGTSYYRVKSIEAGSGNYSPIVKVNSAKASPSFSIYPNPVKDRLQISLINNQGYEKGTVTVRNSQGKTVLQSVNVAVNGYSMDVSPLAAGMYILAITNSAGETMLQKFIKY